MNQGVHSCSRDHRISGGCEATWSRAWRNPRPLAIGSAPHYAQEHNLTVDFYVESSQRAASHLISLNADSQHVKGQQLTGYSHLTQCTIPAPRIDDNWLDTEPSVAYIQQLLFSLDSLCLQGTCYLESRQLAATTLRYELPILSSDNNLDLLSLAHVIFSRRVSRLVEASIPPIEIDASGDDSLQFPCWSEQLTKHFDSHIPKEAIQNAEGSQVPEYAAFYSTAGISNQDKEAISCLIETEFMVYKKSRPRGAVFSSPLLPPQSTYDEFIPDDDTCIINSFSDTVTLLENDIKQVEARLVAEYDDGDIVHSELQTPPVSSPVFPLPEKQEPRISSLKVDVPLTGSDSRPQSDEVQERTPLKDALSSVQSVFGEAKATVIDSEMSDQFPFLTSELATQVREVGQRTLRHVEQERLNGPDSSQRVAVPVMDFTIPGADWKKLPSCAMSHFMSFGLSTPEIVTKRIKSAVKEEKKLRWRPLDGTAGKVSNVERIIIDSEKLGHFFGAVGDTKTDDLSLGHLFTRRTLQFLSDLADEIDEIPIAPLQEQSYSAFPSPEPSPTKLKRTSKSPLQEEPSSKKTKPGPQKTVDSGPSLLLDGDNGVGGLLTSYLQIHALVKVLPTTSSHFSAQAEVPLTGASSITGGPIQPPWEHTMPGSKVDRLPVPCPEFDPTNTASTYIVSTALGKPVIRQLDQLCPMAKLLTRTFGNDLEPSSSSPAETRAAPHLAFEADIPFSSNTGIIVTNLAELLKRPLGSSKKMQLRQKIERVSVIYDKLIVLISVPDLRWTSQDTGAYTAFVAFVGTLNTSVEAVLVGDGEEHLTKWIISFMNEYRCEGRKNEHLIVQEEINWETFFRLGGVNVYAAYVLIGALKAVYGGEGLARLLGMTAEERVSTFGAIIGARRPLDNLNRWLGKTS